MRLLRFLDRPTASVRLVAFPFAGGGASAYHRLAQAFCESVELVAYQPPGREHRLREPKAATFSAAVADALAALEGLEDAPYAVFGHSLGALVAYEALVALRDRGARMPLHLFVSACRPPDKLMPQWATRVDDSDEGLAAWLRTYGAIPGELLADREFQKLVFPVVRADLGLILQYAFRPGRERLPIPMTALAGRADRDVVPESIHGWADHGQGPFSAYTLDGDHFYFRGKESELARLIESELDV